MQTQTTRVAVLTGASSGIGKAAATVLVKRGWFVIGLGRNPERCEQAETELKAAAEGAGRVTMIRADLALLSDTERAAAEISQLTDRVHALLNNAGGVANARHITAEGNESTFASNHLGHFLLTKRLLPLLLAAAKTSRPGATRIVNVSSLAHEYCDGLDFNDLQTIDNYNPGLAYCRVKLANILFTRELARRVADDGIAVHAMHPGVVNSNFASHGDETMQQHMEAQKDTALSPEEAADTLLWLATADEPGASTGDYYHQREITAISESAQDDKAAVRLWEESEKLVCAKPA